MGAPDADAEKRVALPCPCSILWPTGTAWAPATARAGSSSRSRMLPAAYCCRVPRSLIRTIYSTGKGRRTRFSRTWWWSRTPRARRCRCSGSASVSSIRKPMGRVIAARGISAGVRAHDLPHRPKGPPLELQAGAQAHPARAHAAKRDRAPQHGCPPPPLPVVSAPVLSAVPRRRVLPRRRSRHAAGTIPVTSFRRTAFSG